VAREGRRPGEVGARARTEKEVGAFRHLVLAYVDDEQLLPAQLVCRLDAGGDDRMILRGVGPYQHDQIRILDVPDAAGIAAITDGAEEAHRRRVLAVTRG